MGKFPKTLDAKNWSVFLFDCPKTRLEQLIVSLFDCIEQIVPDSLPNYTMRYWNTASIKISLRVLIDGSKKKIVKKLETEILKILKNEGIAPIVNPTGKDQEISGWSIGAPLNKCKAYNTLSEFVVNLAREGQFSGEVRNEMRHLAINMLFMREASISPEKFVYFCDILTETVIFQPYPFPLVKK